MAIGMDDTKAIIEAIIAMLKVFHVAVKIFVKLGKNSNPRTNQYVSTDIGITRENKITMMQNKVAIKRHFPNDIGGGRVGVPGSLRYSLPLFEYNVVGNKINIANRTNISENIDAIDLSIIDSN